MLSNFSTVHLFLRVGVAFALLYPACAAIGDPVSWASYFPPFLRELPLETTTLLHAFGVLEVVLALWILAGWHIRVPTVVTTMLLLAIVGLNLNQFDVLFRDLSIAAMSLALVVWPEAKTNVPTEQLL